MQSDGGDSSFASNGTSANAPHVFRAAQARCLDFFSVGLALRLLPFTHSTLHPTRSSHLDSTSDGGEYTATGELELLGGNIIVLWRLPIEASVSMISRMLFEAAQTDKRKRLPSYDSIGSSTFFLQRC
jgi:hypothetical protein